MTDLQKMLLKAGIIDKNTAQMMEKWHLLEEGASEIVDTEKPTTKTQCIAVGEKISELLDAALEAPMKEARLDVHVIGKPFLVKTEYTEFTGVWDDIGRIVCEPNSFLDESEMLNVVEEGKTTKYQLQYIDKIYQGDAVVGLQLTVSAMD